RLMSSDPLPPVQIALPPQIEKIMARAIIADPDARFESCAAMRRAIEASIHELGLPAENDDVAEFLKQTLPELASKRQRTIEKAMNAAETRPTYGESTPPPMGRDSLEPDAFAPTEVSKRDPQST